MAKITVLAEANTSPPPPPPSLGFFCTNSKSFQSLRRAAPLPPETEPLSFPAYARSLLPSPLPRHPALVDAATGASVSYPQFLSQVRNLSSYLRANLGLSKGHVAFVLSPARLEVPVLYFALLSVGAIVSPANPVSTPAEISRLFRLASPTVAFTTFSTAAKLPRHVTTVLLDSPDFGAILASRLSDDSADMITPAEVWQSDAATIQFSSGTTGPVKAASLPHRGFIAMVAGFHSLRHPESPRDVTLLAAPMFHSLGFFKTLKAFALAETLVVVDRLEFSQLLRVAERHRATQMTAAPPVVAAMARWEEVLRFNLGALERVFCGGAPLPLEAAERFTVRFPSVDLCMAYGTTEAGGISRMISREECRRMTSVGRLNENVEAKIIDIVSGKSLSTHQQGELWIRGPAVMTGYIGNPEANASVFDSDGWLRTGDLCYFDDDGFLFIVDRLKELIKYKAYQVPPAELEQLLQSLPGIVDVAVVPYPHEEAGQIPMAFVVRQPGSNLSEDQVIDFVAKQVAPYKKIRKVAFINSIPKSAAGKILRRELANQALSSFVSSL